MIQPVETLSNSVAVLQGIEQLEPCIIPFQEGKSQFTCQYKMNVMRTRITSYDIHISFDM